MNKELYNYIREKKHHKYRKEISLAFDKDMPPIERMTYRFEQLSKAETPVLLDGEKICFLRTVKNIPDIFTEGEWKEIRSKHFIHELGYMSNLSPDYEGTIKVGLLEKRKSADEYGKRVIDAIIDLSDRYREEAVRLGKTDIAKVLERVPRYGATNFREALQFFRIIHFSLWLEGNYHNTVGRFDKYMYPYLKADMDKGIYTEETALDLVEDFFLSFNKDSDLYVGVQQGDNGQSMVLGGIDENGNGVEAERFENVYRMLLNDTKKVLPDIKFILIEPFVLNACATKDHWDMFEGEVKKRREIVKKLAAEFDTGLILLQDKFDKLADEYGAEVENYGIGGTRIARQVEKTQEQWDRDFVRRVDEMKENADVVVVFGGTNDFGHGDAEIGDFNSRSEYTFYGGMHSLCMKLLNKYPMAQIIFVTPLHRETEDVKINSRGKAVKLPLAGYVRIIKEIAAYYGLPVLDLFSESGIQPRVEIIKKLYMPDGLHPSDLGAERIAQRLYAFLKKL